jgi:hypothetical protein
VCLVIALNTHRRPQPIILAETHLTVVPNLRPTVLHLRLAERRKVKSVPPRLPKLDVFPTAPPLTDEERALLAFVRRDPEGAVKLFQSLENSK